MAVDWIMVTATVISGAIGASGAVLGVWLTTRSTRKLNEDNRKQDKRQELVLSLARWDGYMTDTLMQVKQSKVDNTLYINRMHESPISRDLELCSFLLEEYNLTSHELRASFFEVSLTMLHVYTLLHFEAYEAFCEEHLKRYSDFKQVPTARDICNILQKARSKDLSWDKFKIQVFMELDTLYEGIREELHKQIMQR